MIAKNNKGSYQLLFFPWYIESRNVKKINNPEEFSMDEIEL